MEEAKRRRYDRQLRIWGEHGQARLESCKVCLLHCGPTGVETIKNLVLGGIHSFTLVDDALVTPRDLGNNFFVHESDLGKGRAAAVAAHLHELNTSVAGAFVDESVDVVVDQNPDFFKDFTVVVASRVEMKTLAKLDEACRARDVALVALDTLGLVGTVRLSKTEHRVLEAKPEETDFDLRVNAPWPALIDFAKRFAAGGGGDALRNDAHARAHIPWAVTLVNVVEELGMRGAPAAAWNAERRAAAKAAIKAAFRSPAPSGDDAETEATLAALGDAVLPENATEALAAARHCWKAPGAVPPALAETLSDPRLDALDADARRRFGSCSPACARSCAARAAASRAPRRRRRARTRDAPGGQHPGHDLHHRVVRRAAEAVPRQGGRGRGRRAASRASLPARRREAGGGGDARGGALLLQARRARARGALALGRGRARLGGRRRRGARGEAGGPGRDGGLVRGALRRRARRRRLPRDARAVPRNPLSTGPSNSEDTNSTTVNTTCDVDADVEALRAIVETTLDAIGAEADRARTGALEAMTTEAARCAGGEPHAVAAVLGGVGAQEVIKLVTDQFEPEAHTLVYDAAKAVTAAVL